ncbi:MAG: hypothetical protein PHI18_03565 [bacterium]|nr:hypothetical protein [bacterium]
MTNHPRRFLIGLLFVSQLITVSSFVVAQRHSFLDSDPGRKAWALQYYSGVSMVMQPLKTKYFEGETVRIAYQITCNQGRPLPWSKEEVEMFLMLWQDGNGVQDMTAIDTYTREGVVGREFRDTLELNTFWSVNSGPPSGFYHLTPGHYVGYFDYGVMSNEFEFEIEEPRASLQPLWDSYSRLKMISDRYWGLGSFTGGYSSPELNAPQLLDSLWSYCAPLIAQPSGSIWRANAIGVSWCLMGKYREAWRPVDSLHCEELLIAHMSEYPDRPNSVLILAAATLFRNFTAEELEPALRSYAERKGLTDFDGEIQQMVSSRPASR